MAGIVEEFSANLLEHSPRLENRSIPAGKPFEPQAGEDPPGALGSFFGRIRF